jgi:hypothetical protein
MLRTTAQPTGATEDEQFVARFVALPQETKRFFREIMDWYIRSRIR